MKAAVLEKPRALKVQDVPKPACKSDEVLIKVKACGICGSDIRYFNGENPWALHTLGKHVENPPNIILGHEFAGEVVEIGSERFKHLLGKRVFAEPYNTCGMCEFCRTGRFNLCRDTLHIGHGAGWGKMDYFPGGMADYCQLWGTHAYELPEQVSYEEAAMLDPLAVSVHAVGRAALRPGSDVLVIGAGAIGLCIAQVVKAYGAINVFLTDVYDAPLAVARNTGVNHPINTEAADVNSYVMKTTKGRGVDLVFDTVGTQESQTSALTLLAASGTLVNLVANESKVTYTLMDLSGERSITCSANNNYDDVLTAIRLLEGGLVKLKPLITHRYPLSEVTAGFDTMEQKTNTGAVKVIIVP